MSKQFAFNPKLDFAIERFIDAPTRLVWEALTKPEHLKEWYMPKPWGACREQKWTCDRAASSASTSLWLTVRIRPTSAVSGRYSDGATCLDLHVVPRLSSGCL